MTEFESRMLELLTEIRDEIYRQGHAHGLDGYGRSYILTQEQTP